jgi:adenine-specific DNA glycosylase
MKDNVNPNHYKQGNIEVIDFILDQKFSYMEGNVVKYLSRYKHKNGLEDVKKARWYIDKIIRELENEDD